MTVPAPGVAIKLTVTGNGLVRRGMIRDWGCAYFSDVEGADGIAHEGCFEYPLVESPSPATDIVGDIPTELGPGTYRFTFLKQRVSDISSFVPVPGGTPMETTRGEVFATCETTLDVSGAANITVQVAFSDAACATSSVATSRR
jgi:hypothetical protein